MKVCEIATPALLVDLNAVESNLARMAEFFRGKPAGLRPHFKNHKVPLLAWKQIEAGAIGMCCATLREAEVLVNHGIRSILVANEIAGAASLEWLADLSRHADIVVAVDDERTASEMAATARKRGAALSVVVDIDVGLNRCGVPPGEPARRLAQYVVEQGLRLRGIMGYDGHLQVLPPGPEKDQLVRSAMQSLVDSKNLIEGDSCSVSIVSAGGTGTYCLAGAYPGITEIQAGSYLLMDTLYANRGAQFTPSLTVLATVVSRAERTRAVVDCGVKALSGERGLSTLKGIDGVQLRALHAVHGILEVQSPEVSLDVGQKIEFWVNYSDATVNLHDRMYGIRNGEVEEVFRIER